MPELRERFRNEATAAAGLDHPNIVPVYEAGEEGSVCFIASAYCPGITLAAWLRRRRGPVPHRMAATLVATLAEAVEHAHRRGVLHRDLKPSNVLLEFSARGPRQGDGTDNLDIPDDDDGSARPPRHRLRPGQAHGRRATDSAGPTLSGVIMGTPSYMAPEQAEGGAGRVGPAADIYSLGRDPLRGFNRPAAVPGGLDAGDPGTGAHPGPATAVAAATAPAPRPGDDLPEMPAQVAAGALCQCPGPGRRPAAVPCRRADPGPADSPIGAGDQVDAAPSGRRGDGGLRLGRRHHPDGRRSAWRTSASSTSATAPRRVASRPWPTSARPARPSTAC